MSTRTVPPVLHASSPRPKPKRRRSPAARLVAPPPLPVKSTLPRLVSAKGGDHQAIHRLLLAAFQGPTSEEFHAQLGEPGYDPADRLVVKQGEHLAAHVRATRRTIRLGSLAIPSVRLMDLATAAEQRGLGFASSLIVAAERRAREQGVFVGLTRTRAAMLFARQGWSVCGRHTFSTAGARQILAQLNATSEGVIGPRERDDTCSLMRTRPLKIAIRPLRRIELPAVIRLYEQSLAGRFGSPLRSDAYWEWLINRAACDRIYVAAEGPESPDLSQQLANIRGAVFIREGRMVELLVEAGRRDIAEHLTARVCADASEQDHWQLRLDSPADDPLHDLFQAAGGRFHQAEVVGGEVFMAKVMNPLGLLALLGGTLADRLRDAELTKPLQFGLEIQCGAQPHRAHAVEVARLRLVFAEGAMTVVKQPLVRNYLSLRRRDLTPLLLGHWNLPDLIAAGRIRASTPGAAQIGRVLFPKLPWWRPPLDDLLAQG
ncbi:MAG: GNAT family N-acetyltransferase [Pirellulaceae bacterium]